MKEYYFSILKLGLPVLVTQVGIIIVSMADTLMVGHYGTDELAAAAFVNSCFNVTLLMLIGFASGLTPLIGSLYSQGRLLKAGTMMKAGIYCNVIVSLVLTAVMGVLYFFLDKLNQPPELIPLMRPYYLIIVASALPLAIFNTCQQTANGSTDTAMPMWIMLGGNVLNIFGNYLLIYGHWGCPEMGLTGAGVATLVSRILMAVAIVVCIRVRKRYRDYIRGFRESLRATDLRRRVFVTSYPVMLQSGLECMLWSAAAVVCGTFGTVPLASYQVINTIGQLGFMIYVSFSIATSIRISNYYGLDDWTGIRRTATAGLHINLLLAVMSSLIFIIFGKPLISIFTPDPEVVAAGMILILPLVLYQFADAVQYNYANALRGVQYVKPLFYISLICYPVIGVPAMLLLAYSCSLQAVGVYLSFSVALIAASCGFIYSFRRLRTAD